ncbi:hypothetical protein BGZ96_002339 [Linnemannia gamsii]|uniref:ABC transporter domain-containing protein n=1 Tax=Linnemannia gamsii TaxID=64522 RepID=A0ABQ7K9G7_9FUNG|nr:hypothetical protein BGZ96_002339 [Linnemannia gamsii]
MDQQQLQRPENGIEVTVRNLSLSVIPPPSILTRVARKLNLAPNSEKKKQQTPTQSTNDDLTTLSENKPISNEDVSPVRTAINSPVSNPTADQDLKHVGINIIRNVDLTVKPGQAYYVASVSLLTLPYAFLYTPGRMIGPEIITSGDIRFNDQKPKRVWNDGSIGYLQQYDVLMPFLTVMTEQKKLELVELVLLELGLKDCAETRVGDPGGGESGSSGIRGISGGERRRVSAGLDAFSSFEVMKSVIKLAHSSQKTIIISIHQPRSEIFKLLSESNGQMILLSKGDAVYSGPVCSALPWIESTGVGICPSGVNPFDYLLDLSMVDFASETTEKTTAVRRELLVQAWADRRKNSKFASLTSWTNGGESSALQDSVSSSFATLAVDMILSGPAPSLLRQIKVLTSRGWRNQIRDSIVLWGCIGESIVIGLVVGCIFYQLNDSLEGIRSRSSVIFVVSVNQVYIMLMVLIYRLSQEIVIYDRERADHWYGPLAHLISSVLHSAIPNIIYPVVFSSIVYYMTGLRTDSLSHFVWWTLVNIGMQFVTSIPAWLRWIKYLAYTNLGYTILASNEFTDRVFACPHVGPNGRADLLKCAPYKGNIVLLYQLDVKTDLFPGPIARLAYYFFGFLFVAWLALTVHIVKPKSVGSGPTFLDFFIKQAVNMVSCTKRATTGQADLSVNFEKTKLEETRLDVFSRGLDRRNNPITIRVEALSLSVFVPTSERGFRGFLNSLKKETRERKILHEVDVVFPAGELTAILGGSGAGKTSLLNALLHRTPGNLEVKGDIYFNDSKNSSLRAINAVTSYVRQDDNFLLSYLTVRETLQYAAELQMDESIPRAGKYAKVEDLIDLLGLRECADVLIGNHDVKGCSGGQRRRVSIGVKLVTEPSCLFLDEPTSGLDALTAKAVVLTLKQIAASGRTVICTIHQPRTDIWHVFDNVVLLVMGGRAVYSGRADRVVDYFAEAGHIAPAFTNVPDFILDTASVNLRSAQLEEDTQKVVDALVDRFNANKKEMLASQLPTHAPGQLPKCNPQYAHFTKAFPILAHRSFVNTFRQKGLYFNKVFQPFIIAISIVIYFAPLGNQGRDFISRLGLLQQIPSIIFSGIFNNIGMYPFERDIAYHEISDGGYSPTSFFISYLINEVPLEIFSSLGATGIILVSTGMKVTMQTFISSWVIIFGYMNTGESIGMAFSTFATHDGFNVTAMSAVIFVFSLMTGFISLNIPKWLEYINYISLLKYGAVIMARSEFEDLVFDCSPRDVKIGACPFPTGQDVLRLLHFQDKDWYLYMGLFVTVMVLYRLLAWLIILAKIKSHRW